VAAEAYVQPAEVAPPGNPRAIINNGHTVGSGVGRWKADATMFLVSVTRRRDGYAEVNLPKPIAVHLGQPKKVTFRIEGSGARIDPAKESEP
jgi:hypothetical protein